MLNKKLSYNARLRQCNHKTGLDDEYCTGYETDFWKMIFEAKFKLESMRIGIINLNDNFRRYLYVVGKIKEYDKYSLDRWKETAERWERDKDILQKNCKKGERRILCRK